MKHWLCKLGFHKWRYFLQSPEWYAAFEAGNYRMISRYCKHCRSTECSIDGTIWTRRL